MGAAGTPVLDCMGCGEMFTWDSSPDLDRCLSCAETHEWHEALWPLAGRPLTEV